MQRLTRLTVIAPGFRRALALAGGEVRLPVLERLIARAKGCSRHLIEPAFQALEAWQWELARRLPSNALPSAPVSAHGAGLSADTGTWLHAQFVHIAAGLDHLILVPLHDEQAVDADSKLQLRARLEAHVQEEGYRWLNCGLEHFLHISTVLHAETCAPEAAARLPFVEAMPRGPDGPRLRRLMTELQMQLHEHPVNRRRERAGLLAANAVWLWGAGELPLERGAAVTWMHAFSDDNYVRGLYRLHDRPCSALPSNGAALLDAAAGEALVLLHCASPHALDRDWLAAFEHALNSGHIEELRLILDDMHLIADRWSRWRFWRRVQPATQVLA